jgi:hypothetical protein
MRRQGRRKEHAQREGWKTRHSVITGVAVSATSVLGFAQGASATNFVVNNGGDGGDGVCQDVSSGDCTLRDAVYSANDNTGYDAVTFASSISGATLSATIGVYDGVRIQGNGAAATTISGNHVGGIFLIATGVALVLKTSMWAKRHYVRVKRWQPKAGRWMDWALRRQSHQRREAIRKAAEEPRVPESRPGN